MAKKNQGELDFDKIAMATSKAKAEAVDPDDDATDEELAAADAAEAPEANEIDAGAAPSLEIADEEADEAAYRKALLKVSDREALAEFGDYDPEDDDHREDFNADPAERSGATAAGGEPDDALRTPKERSLASMRLEARIEAVIFAAKAPMRVQEILDLLADPTLKEDDVQETLDHLVEFYETRNGGFRLHYLKRIGYQFQTADAAGPIMERMFASRPRPISRAALETLAIIAYRQPVTRAEVEFIRGVDAGSIFKTLLERDLIKCVGRKEIIGRPMIFGTTDEFLKVFNLSSVKDLPPLESFQPNREVVQGAMEKIEEGDELVDVEEYIADNTAGEYASGVPDPFEQSELGLEQETLDGTTQDTEVAIPNGDSLKEGSGGLDY